MQDLFVLQQRFGDNALFVMVTIQIKDDVSLFLFFIIAEYYYYGQQRVCNVTRKSSLPHNYLPSEPLRCKAKRVFHDGVIKESSPSGQM